MLVHFDGFDSYTNLTDFTLEYGNGTTTFSTSSGRYGGGGLTFTGANYGYLTRQLPALLTEMWVGYAFSPSGVIGSSGGIVFYAIGASGAEFYIANNGTSFKFYRGATLVGTYAGTIASGWHWVEFHYKLSASVGVAEVWVDGVQIGSFSGNTSNASSVGISQIQLGSSNANYTFAGVLDDPYIIDATQGDNTGRLGDCRIATLLPTANAGPNDGTPSTGSAYTCVDEAQWNSTDYVTLTNTTGQEELYTMGALPTSPASVFGVRVLSVAQKSDAGSAGFYPTCKSGSTEGSAAGTTMPTTWGKQYGIIERDPATNAAWATAAVNAMSCGVKVV